MRRVFAVVLSVFVSIVALASTPSTVYRVKYDGGSLFGLGLGDDAKVRIEEREIQILDKKEDVLIKIPVSSVTEISFGHDVPRRIRAATGVAALTPRGEVLAVSAGRKFVGVTWMSGERKGGFAMHCDGSAYRVLLAQLEGVTGKKSLNSDAEIAKN